jgi:hypothetical protein
MYNMRLLYVNHRIRSEADHYLASLYYSSGCLVLVTLMHTFYQSNELVVPTYCIRIGC